MIIIHITDLDYKFSLIYYIHTLTFAHKIKQYTLQVCIYIYIDQVLDNCMSFSTRSWVSVRIL